MENIQATVPVMPWVHVYSTLYVRARPHGLRSIFGQPDNRFTSRYNPTP